MCNFFWQKSSKFLFLIYFHQVSTEDDRYTDEEEITIHFVWYKLKKNR